MRIIAVELFRLRLTWKRPFETSYGTLTEKETIIVRARSADGLVGYGEAPALQIPYYLEEWTDSALLALERFIVPSILNQELGDAAALEACYRWVRGSCAAKAGIEAAFWDIRAQEEGIPLHKLWGGHRDRIEAGISLGAESELGRLIEKVGRAVEDGYRRVKVKIMPGRDVEVIRVIREAHPDVALMADANSAYAISDAGHLRELDAFRLMMLEQPLGWDDILDHAELQQEIDTPICLDESIRSAGDAEKALRIGAARIINVKPARLGGYRQAMLTAGICAFRGAPAWCGGMFETGLGKAFNVHLSSLPSFNLPGDIASTDQYFERDVLVEPIVVDGEGCIRVPENPGVGVEIDTASLNSLRIGHRIIRA
ncbi:MAG TPA: o-succinylbenzoate synthase [Chloroflexota bacterium]|nr:o-succinylbenzoate synthase [Chloroflexota bacterium]